MEFDPDHRESSNVAWPSSDETPQPPSSLSPPALSDDSCCLDPLVVAARNWQLHYAAASPVEYDGAVAAARTRGIAARMTDGEARHSALGAASAGAKLRPSGPGRHNLFPARLLLLPRTCVCVYSLHSSYGQSFLFLRRRRATPARVARSVDPTASHHRPHRATRPRRRRKRRGWPSKRQARRRRRAAAAARATSAASGEATAASSAAAAAARRAAR